MKLLTTFIVGIISLILVLIIIYLLLITTNFLFSSIIKKYLFPYKNANRVDVGFVGLIFIFFMAFLIIFILEIGKRVSTVLNV